MQAAASSGSTSAERPTGEAPLVSGSVEPLLQAAPQAAVPPSGVAPAAATARQETVAVPEAAPEVQQAAQEATAVLETPPAVVATATPPTDGAVAAGWPVQWPLPMFAAAAAQPQLLPGQPQWFLSPAGGYSCWQLGGPAPYFAAPQLGTAVAYQPQAAWQAAGSFSVAEDEQLPGSPTASSGAMCSRRASSAEQELAEAEEACLALAEPDSCATGSKCTTEGGQGQLAQAQHQQHQLLDDLAALTIQQYQQARAAAGHVPPCLLQKTCECAMAELFL